MKNESLGLGGWPKSRVFLFFSITLSVVHAMLTSTTKILLLKILVMNSGFKNFAWRIFKKIKSYSLKKIKNFQDPV